MLKNKLCLYSLLLSLCYITPTFAGVFTVTKTADTDGTCTVSDCSLREAIKAVNNSAPPNEIQFNIPLAGNNCQLVEGGEKVCTITIDGSLSFLPAIEKQVVIDGSILEKRNGIPGSVANPSQSATQRPGIELDGHEISTSSNPVGYLITLKNTQGSVVKGLILNRIGCYDGAFSNCGGLGIIGGSHNRVVGNYIGTNIHGFPVDCVANGLTDCNPHEVLYFPVNYTFGYGNTLGIDVRDSSHHNIIGGFERNQRNILVNNFDAGIVIFGSSYNLVKGNFVGVDVMGAGSLAVVDGNPLTKHGGSGNTGEGIDIQGDVRGFDAINNVVVANIVAATSDRPGIRVFGDKAVGFPGAKSENTIVIGNSIGMDINGNPLPNRTGISLFERATESQVGFFTIGDIIIPMPNRIAYNLGVGIMVLEGDDVPMNNTILFNSISDNMPLFSNEGLGIDLSSGSYTGFNGDGVLANDANDADNGANGGQNFPDMDTAKLKFSVLLNVKGALHSKDNTRYRIDVYANDTMDPSGHGEGKHWIGSFKVKTDGAGNATIDKYLLALEHVAKGDYITTTATEIRENGPRKLGNTSEFSLGVIVN